MSSADWRSSIAYEALDILPSRALAWEYLRRNPEYVSDFVEADTVPRVSADAIAQAWGLRFAADPRLPAHETPVFWSAHAVTAVVMLAELPSGFATTLTAELPKHSVERIADDGLHRLGSDHAAQLWLIDRCTADGALGVVLPLDDKFPERAAAAVAFWRRTRGLADTSPMSPTTQRRHRLILGLRALDGRAEGASYREIASALFGAQNVPAGRAWKTHDLRSRTLRLVADATALMRGGYRELLR